MNSTTIDKSMNGSLSITDGIITIEEGGITFSDGSVLDSITDIPLLSGNNTFTGSNTFNNNIIAPTAPTLTTNLTNKAYVDDSIATSITNLKTANNTFSGVNTFSGKITTTGISNTGNIDISGNFNSNNLIYTTGNAYIGQCLKIITATPIYTSASTNANFSGFTLNVSSVSDPLYNYALGTYNVSASSRWDGSYEGYLMFNISSSNKWVSGWGTYNITTGLYNGSITTTTTTGTITGEYNTIQLPYLIKANSLKIRNLNVFSMCKCKDFVFIGSTDGTTWTVLLSSTVPSSAESALSTFSFTNDNFYNYFRIIMINGNRTSQTTYTACGISVLYILGDIKYNPTITNTLEIYGNTTTTGDVTINGAFNLSGISTISAAVNIDSIVSILNNSGSDGYGYGALQLTQGGLYAHEISCFNKELIINGNLTALNINGGVILQASTARSSLIIDCEYADRSALIASSGENVVVGKQNLIAYNSTTASNNVIFGKNNYLTAITNQSNTGVGNNNFRLAISNFNIGIGSWSFKTHTASGDAYNIGIGYDVCQHNVSGFQNVGIGYNAGQNTTGSFNTFIGSQSGASSLVSYSQSTAVGYLAEITDSNQVSLGRPTATAYVNIGSTKASSSTTTGALVVAGGVGIAGEIYVNGTLNNIRLKTNTAKNSLIIDTSSNNITNLLASGTGNNVFGVGCASSITSGSNNLILGVGCMPSQTSGSSNISIGDTAAVNLLSGSSNISIGTSSGILSGTSSSIIAGDANIYLGAYTGADNTGFSRSSALGYGARISASDQIVLGIAAVDVKILGTLNSTKMKGAGTNVIIAGSSGGINTSLLSGTHNYIIGHNNYSNSPASAVYNIAIGSSVSPSLTSGSFNIGLGENAFANATNGSLNISMGHRSLQYMSSGDSNVSIGYVSGKIDTETGTFSGSNNTFLGTQTQVLSGVSNVNNSTALGYGAKITTSNQVVLGRNIDYVSVPSTTGSSNTTTGALVVGGGVGIGQNLTVYNTLQFSNYGHIKPLIDSGSWNLVNANSSYTITLATGMSFDLTKPYIVRVLFRTDNSSAAPSATSQIIDITQNHFAYNMDGGYIIAWTSSTEFKIKCGDTYVAYAWDFNTSLYKQYTTGYYRFYVYA